MTAEHGKPLTAKLIDSLYLEAMTLADQARQYFDQDGKFDREDLGPIERVQFSCESLRVTTRLMHTVSWLLNRKAVAAGELSEEEGREPERRLGRAGDAISDKEVLDAFPVRAREVIEASADLYTRVRRLDEGLVIKDPRPSPARQLQDRLGSSF